MKKQLLVGASAIVLLTACNDDDTTTTFNATPQSQLQAVHAVYDAPTTQVVVGGQTVLDNLNFGKTSGYLSLNEGVSVVSVDANLPGNETLRVIDSESLDLFTDKLYTAFVVGTVDDNDSFPIEAIVAERSAETSAGMVAAQVVHAASNAPEVDVYVTAPGVAVDAAAPLGTLAYKASSGVAEVAPGDYRIQITLANSQTVVFDSGTVSLPAGALTVAAIPNPAGTSPVRLIALDGSDTPIAIADVNETAGVKVGHLAVDVPAVDVSVNGQVALEDVVYGNVTDHIELQSGTNALAISLANVADPTLGPLAEDLAGNADYSAYAIGTLAGGDLDLLVFEDDRRGVATAATLNIIHAASRADKVDIYVTADGIIDNIDPTLTNIPYKANTLEAIGSIYLAEGTYKVTVTQAGTKQAAIDGASVTVQNGQAYQAIAVNESAGGVGLELQVVTDM
uniref:DUF4397 domain-containing protein n=1 Tax=Thaumasiovibrio occultus TaxID=1891184 RepID=UPI000B361434|nr:DUF4397 domain-containing protein [Thaumasiovibrio occultus]